jgi:ankyrin repeat protein
MPEPTRSLPPAPSLEQQKKLAKELLDAFRAGDPDARARLGRALPDKRRMTLADAQFALAREYGFESWARLKAEIRRRDPDALAPAAHEAFRRAFEARDAAAVRRLLEEHPAARRLIDEPLFPFDAPALVCVAGQGDLAMVDVLLEFGADPNRRSGWWAGGFHALHSAKGDVADRLLAAGAVPDACAAAHLDRLDLLRGILDADPERVHERGGDGQTPLHFACSPAAVDLLLERGADPDARDLDHRATAAQWMLERRRGAGRYELARHLIERGAGADVFLAAALGLVPRLRALLEADPSLLERRTGQGEYGEQPPSSFHIYTWTIGQNLSPLQVAAQFEQDGAVDLLRSFASPRVRFVAACSQGRGDEARGLLDEHPTLIDELTVEDARTLPDAGWAANAAAVELMLDLGFEPSVPGSSGGTVLHAAAWVGSAACVEIALHQPAVRALIEQPDPRYRSTPLGWCCHGARNSGRPRHGHAAVARLLLEAGARTTPDLDPPAEVSEVIRAFRGVRHPTGGEG